MPSFIVKPKRAEDFYVEWSTIVDSPTAYGSRSELEEFLGPITARNDRFQRADDNGTSELGGKTFGWDCEEFTVHNLEASPGLVSRDDLHALCDRIGTGSDTSDLIRPFIYEENN